MARQEMRLGGDGFHWTSGTATAFLLWLSESSTHRRAPSPVCTSSDNRVLLPLFHIGKLQVQIPLRGGTGIPWILWYPPLPHAASKPTEARKSLQETF
jgi:hypothetical protein